MSENNLETILSEKLELTDVEIEWLENHPVIRVGSDPNWAPFEYRDKNGNYHGIDIDYLKIIEKKLGVKFEFTQDKTWNEIFKKAQTQEIDIFSSVSQTKARSEFLNFTKPYVSNPISIFANADIAHIRNLNELDNKKVAVVKGYFTEELLKEKYPNIDLVLAKSPQNALNMLHQKKVVAYVEGMVTASYYLIEKKYYSIRIVGDTPFDYNISIGVRKDWDIFHTIIQKALESISITERNNIYYSWISLTHNKKINYRLLYEIIIPLLVILIFFVFWNRKLRKEVNKREQAQLKLNFAFKELKETQTHLVQNEKMASVGFLTAGIAHEIKNPLNYISLGINGIKDGLESIIKITEKYDELNQEIPESKLAEIEELKEKLDFDFYKKECITLTDDLQGGVDTISEITKSLNTFSFFAGDNKVLADINKGIESTLVILRNQYKYSIEIIKDLEDLPQIKCFPGKLNQVYVNIISNAIQAIENEGTITIRTYTKDNELLISVKDSGKGMDENIIKRIFDPFFTTKQIGKGTGLGLSISKNIIDEHNGEIEVISQKDIGTEFLIHLPIEL
ncbi:MAG: transporter substrate-binding domain-containing protein [Bacteroidales bacterium]|nr:transporter substrate-binding domain-containing protein [Bacteroidales bacterium]